MNKVILNYTPHAIVLCGKSYESNGVARCKTLESVVAEINGIKVNKREFGGVEGLPEPAEGVVYVVSSIVAQALKGSRDDVFVPDEFIRDEKGNIIGCEALACL
jgi:hypothetical protein